MYQLQCVKCNTFYIGEMGQMNEHWSTCTIMNPNLLFPHQIPPAPFSGMLICLHHTQTPWCHPKPSAANIIPTCTSIQAVFRHKHSLNLSLLLPVLLPFFPLAAPSNVISVSLSTANENHNADWKLLYFLLFWRLSTFSNSLETWVR